MGRVTLAGRRVVAWRVTAGERGSASLVTLGVGLAVLLFAAGLAGASAATVGRHEAQRAADLAALAGARYSVDGPAVACARAAGIADRNGAQMTACQVAGLDLIVTVDWRIALLGRVASATARAGPFRAPAD